MNNAHVVGVDVAAARVDAAESAAEAVVGGLIAQGVSSERVVVGLHRVLSSERDSGRFALSVDVADVDEDQAWQLVREAVARTTAAHEATVVQKDRVGGPVANVAAARAAVEERVRGTGGRAMYFTDANLEGAVPVAEVLAKTHIDLVVDLEGGTPEMGDLLLVSGPLQPRWNFGRLVLFVLPAAGTCDSVYVPFGYRVPERAGLLASL